MNYSVIRYLIGWILNLEAALMLLPCLTALIYQEKAGLCFLVAIVLCLVLGIPLVLKKPQEKAFYLKEGLVITALSWLILSIVGAIPMVLSGAIPHFVDALFEIVSGFTTTGASILSDLEGLPRCVLIWRSFTHWIGGMGILVFVLSVLPLSGGYHMHLMRAESPGPSVSRLVPKVQSTAKILYLLYLGLTILEILLLSLGNMPFFDTLCITFGTAGTGGFGVLNDSCASYSAYDQIVITVFMLLFGVNFNVYFLLIMKKFGQALRVEELRYYFGIVAAAIAAIALNIYHMIGSVGLTLREASFQVASIITTTGFSTADFDLWPSFSKTILVTLMFVGACAGSTGGGLKVSRIMILVKSVAKEIQLSLHPHAVKKIKMDDKPVSLEVIRSANTYLVVYILIFVGSFLLISLDAFDFTSNFTAVAATLNNIGPGLNLVGPTQNFALFSIPSKLILTFDMLAGRLELFPMLVLFFHRTWRKF